MKGDTDMDRHKLAIIRVMTLPESANKTFSNWLNNQFPSLDIMAYAIADQPDGVHDSPSYAKAEPKVVELIHKLSVLSDQDIFVNCAEDPGVTQGRTRVRIPVWGAGSSAACIAKGTGLPTGVIGLTEEIPAVIANILGDQIVVSTVPTGVQTALDLNSAAGSITKAAQFCLDRGARCILLACTGMSLLGTADYLCHSLSIPVIDPLLAPLAVMQQFYSNTPFYPASSQKE
jgi:allantoin racemase